LIALDRAGDGDPLYLYTFCGKEALGSGDVVGKGVQHGKEGDAEKSGFGVDVRVICFAATAGGQAHRHESDDEEPDVSHGTLLSYPGLAVSNREDRSLHNACAKEIMENLAVPGRRPLASSVSL
jgi:hypothetical protein